MKKLLIVTAILGMTTVAHARINPNSPIGQDFHRGFMHSCVQEAINSGTSLSLARQYCDCTANFMMARITVSDLENNTNRVMKIMDQAVSHCVKQLSR